MQSSINLRLECNDGFDRVASVDHGRNFGKSFFRTDQQWYFGFVDRMSNAIDTEIGINGDNGYAVLEACISRQDPFGSSLSQDCNPVPRLQSQVPQGLAQDGGFACKILKSSPMIFAQNVLLEDFSIRLNLIFFSNDFSRS